MNELTITKDGLSKAVRKQMVTLINRMKKDEETYNAMREKLLNQMELFDIKKIENEEMTIEYIAETEAVKLDTKKVRDQFPQVYVECTKKSNVKSQVRIKIK